MTPIVRLTASLLFVLALTVPPLHPAPAQQGLRAAAVVNDKVVSVLDLELRLRLVMLSAGLQDTAQQRQRIAPQVLRTLIDEELQLQEAKRLGYEVTAEEIDRATRQIAENNNLTLEQFRSLLERNSIPLPAFRDQVRANIAWQKIIARRIGSDVTITDEEVERVVERTRSRQGEILMRVREIFLATNGSEDLSEVRETAERLVEELRQGADFAALARQFSQSATAAVGGDIGWVLPANLSEEVAEALRRMEPGMIAGPVKSFNGLHIVKLEDTRRIAGSQGSVHLKQLFVPLAPDAGESAAREARQRLGELAGQANGCDGFEQLAEGTGGVSSSDLGELQVANLPDRLRQTIGTLPVGEASDPVDVNEGIAVLMVCGRSGQGVDREQIRENLRRERVDMLAQRYMRDLRRQAHIDIRL